MATNQVTQHKCARMADWRSAIASARGTAQAAHNTALLLKPVASAARFRSLSALAGSLRSEVAALEAEFRAFKSKPEAQHSSKRMGKDKGQAGDDVAPMECSSVGGKPRRRRHRPKKRASSAPAEPAGLPLVPPPEAQPVAVASRRVSASSPPSARTDVDQRERSPRGGRAAAAVSAAAAPR